MEEEPVLLTKLLSENATLPKRTTAGAAGYDLASAVDITVPAWSNAAIATDVAVAIPPGTYGRIAPRSGLAMRNKLNPGGGVIDGDFTGPLVVILFNHSDTDFKVEVGDRIAQLILERIITPEVKQVDELPVTKRGGDGLGSTGVKKQKREPEAPVPCEFPKIKR